MKILKIGGSVLKNASGFDAFLKIIHLYKDTNCFCVISAIGKTTRNLVNAANISIEKGFAPAQSLINDIQLEHFEIINKLFPPSYALIIANYIKSNVESLIKLLKGLSITKDLTPKTLDLIMSFGELFAISIISEFLKLNSIDAKVIDATDFLITDNSFGNANPIIQDTKKRLFSIINDSNSTLFITQGFVGKSVSGDITTMGIESSNLTAAILSHILDADELVYWTDVPGIMDTDPNLSINAKTIKKLDYEDALWLANNGLKLIYPRMIELLRYSNAKVVYRYAFDFDADYTVVESCIGNPNPPVLITLDNQFFYSHPLMLNNLSIQNVNYPRLFNENNEFKSVNKNTNSVCICNILFIDNSDFVKFTSDIVNCNIELLYIEYESSVRSGRFFVGQKDRGNVIKVFENFTKK